MRELEDLAERLVQYDRNLAADVVQLIVERLDGPVANGPPDLERAHAFLTRAGASSVDEPKTTAEWKLEWAQRERVRALGVLIAELLH